MKQHIMFDLDDTLIHCNKYFYLVISQFVDAMTTWFAGYEDVTANAVRDKQTEIDIAGIAVLGFKSEHFPQSFVDSYAYFSDVTGRKRSTVEQDFLWKLGLSVYEHDTEPYPNMEETLYSLANQGHELHLYTGGEQLIQTRKIDQLNLSKYFNNRIYIRQHKTNEALEDILAETALDRARTWMVGNSIRTDVVPALTAGIHAIHMRKDAEWQYNVVNIEVEPKGAFFTLNDLVEVPEAIYGYINR
ncbi:putative hydrolase of the HAD superfamily [Paenibacillus algorifonticola]|uniref:Putative hydrolase of the HAD superfamily n=1 Tax=Paenibacillus algorifonticola TaxID=684063 RepID=A0A1I2BQ37_9BACL|nr:HAD family hydrolase [Paenibacillus algorifonticola]SFE58232.1 putative hydrolase of the HAD superfamily [Paenibacillus algorifonticola]